MSHPHARAALMLVSLAACKPHEAPPSLKPAPSASVAHASQSAPRAPRPSSSARTAASAVRPPVTRVASEPGGRGCAQRMEDNRTALALLTGCLDCVAAALRFAGECRQDPKGTWMISVTNPSLDVAEGAVRQYGFGFMVAREVPCRDAAPCPYVAESDLEHASVKVDAKRHLGWTTFDYDHDGVPEVLVDTGTVEVFTARLSKHDGWEVSRYPTVRWRVDASEDVDHDGRPDLWMSGGYAGAAMFLAHSLPDGSFSETDDVAKGAFARGCPPAGEELAGALEADTPDLVRRIACARARGRSAADVETALASLRVPATKPRDGGVHDPELPKPIADAVKLVPPVTLP